jgi:PAS domain S-box-containing protein
MSKPGNGAPRHPSAQNRTADSRVFELLVQGVTDYAIYMLDPEGRVSTWNAGARRLKGYDEAEIIGRHFSRFFTEEDKARGLPAVALETARRVGRFEAEGWRIRKDGTRFWANAVIDPLRDETGAFIGFAKITRDITRRQQDDDRLRESERQFRLLVNGVTDYALYMLDLNGNVTSWNSGAERIKGYAAQEIIGQHFSRFYTEADRVSGLPARALATAAETGRFEAEGWRVRKDGFCLWASVVIDAVRDETGKLVGFAKITRDISERRAAQVSMQKMQAQLAEAQKMDALGQLTGGVAHDFNNLLMIVSGHIATLKKIAGDNPKALRATDAVQTAAQRGAALTRQLLSFSRRQRVNPRAVAIADQVAAFREMLTSAVGSNIRVVLDIPATTWMVKVDVNEFEIALVNMVLNARDAMPEGGVVTIIAENVDVPPSELPHAIAGEHVALTVADTGIGIAPDVLGRIFDPFFTTKAAGKGTGLGLSQVFGFAHQAGGAVKAESTLGRGTRITLCLPRTTEQPAAAPGPPPAANPGGIRRVLLVEDNPDVSTATAELLETLGYEVHAVTDAAAALAVLEGGATVDLVVSDIVMPGPMDGLALTRAVAKRFPRIPVLLVTGYSEAALNAKNEYPILHKPYELHELGAAIANLTRGRDDDNLLPFRPRKANDRQNGH